MGVWQGAVFSFHLPVFSSCLTLLFPCLCLSVRGCWHSCTAEYHPIIAYLHHLSILVSALHSASLWGSRAEVYKLFFLVWILNIHLPLVCSYACALAISAPDRCRKPAFPACPLQRSWCPAPLQRPILGCFIPFMTTTSIRSQEAAVNSLALLFYFWIY